jgi:NAD(P)-dependent dehydrogenase (short-subunit alcohol dehydrogenase family)
VSIWNMQRKVCVMTGATGGIGGAAAEELMAAGADLHLVVRNRARGERVLRALQDLGPGHARLVVADLSSFAGVRDAAAELAAGAPRVDVLIHGAAVIPAVRQLSADGVELQWAVNHLAPFLLTHLLRERLDAAGGARVVTIASQVESSGRIDFDDLNLDRGYDRVAAYCRTKLANILFTLELARRLAGTSITATCLHPGVCATRLLHDYVGRPRVLDFLTTWRNPGPAAAGRHVARLAASPELAGVSGAYFMEDRPATPSPAARDPETADRLWRVSAAQVGLPAEAR